MRSRGKNVELPTSRFHRTHYHWSITVNVYKAAEGMERGRDRWGSRRVFETGQRQTASPECCGTADLSSVCLLLFTATAVGSTLPLLTCASRQAHQTGTFIKPNSLRLIGPHPHLLSLTFVGEGYRRATTNTNPLRPQTRQRQGHLNCRWGAEALLFSCFGWVSTGVCVGMVMMCPISLPAVTLSIPVCPGAGGMRARWASFVSS